jgi:hypothetical protein
VTENDFLQELACNNESEGRKVALWEFWFRFEVCEADILERLIALTEAYIVISELP